MFAKIAVLFTASMAVLVAAGDINDSCNTGAVQCCNTSYAAGTKEANLLASLVGVVAGAITGQVGVNCTPVSVLAIAGNSCSTQPVCCTSNHFNGLVNVGCNPVNANL
ncbi:Fruiting body protein SC1 [Psilocybe cubensis]|uniref:Fruiting body protein SC1 n=2 Tax=Psilocybe cubensis TaxID=181762 RepID=A0ACB8GIP6_PSICU|nr:Fruiting body protein SC1 [Psilocybe cubensis]KAH9475272.1 Fruiting body protein SC1 [Psilocybe cubensis]